MTRVVVVGEVAADGSLTKLSTEVATLARSLGDAVGVMPVAGAEGAAAELARFLPEVIVDAGAAADGSASERAAVVAAGLDDASVVLLPASADGRDLAGALSALTCWG